MSLENIVRENIIRADSRKFGTIFEFVLEQINGLTKADSVSHDRYCAKSKKRIEMKSVRVFEKLDNGGADKIAEWVLSQNPHKNLVADKDKFTASWDGGFGQIKPDCFDVLYYTTVFHDRIYMFKANRDDLLNDKGMGYCLRENRNGNSGQFYMSSKSIAYHIQKYLFFTLTYEQLVFILQSKNVKLNVA